MKPSQKTLRNLRPFAAILFSALVLSASSCRKETEEDPAVSADDAADAIEASLAKSSGGMANEMGSMAQLCDDGGVYRLMPDATLSTPIQCGVQYDSTITRAFSNSTTSFNYSVSWDYMLTCNNNVPSSFAFNHTMNGNYDAPRVSSNDNASGGWTITGFENTSTVLTCNGNYTRNGSQTSKVRNHTTFTSEITLNMTNVTINKSDKTVAGGSASVSINGSTSAGKAYSFTGQIVFNGNGSATLTLNGNTYTITIS